MGLANCPATATPAVVFTKCDNTEFNPVTDRVATCDDIPAVTPVPLFATPAQTIAGTSTTTIVNPADLTAKLANQPASGTCTDREDVVWNGTILQGAAKHYEFSGKFGITPDFASSAGYVWQAGPAGMLSAAPLTITNPSACRTLRVHINELSSRFEVESLTTTTSTNQVAVVSVGGVEIAENLGVAIYLSTTGVTNNHNEYMVVGYYDIPPSGSATFTLSNYLKYFTPAGAVTFTSPAYNYASASFRAYTI
jgi:hypothetical protein